MPARGMIAIDIDGTLTAVPNLISLEVARFLQSLFFNKWQLVFVTGRTLHWSEKLLKQLGLPFYTLSVFNGAYTAVMPEGKLLKKRYLDYEQVKQVLKLVGDRDVAIAIYGDIEREMRSYIYRHHATHVLLSHLQARAKALQENWTELVHAHDLPEESFVAIRLFCLPTLAKTLSLDIEEKLKLHSPVMRDSYNDQFSVVQVTQAGISKAHALETAIEHFGKPPIVIACGDDMNDIPMLEKADIKVVMATAPPDLLRMADIIAPPAKNRGIIVGLTNAIRKAGIR